MKRFSKIFCIALIAIIFLVSNVLTLGKSPLARAEDCTSTKIAESQQNIIAKCTDNDSGIKRVTSAVETLACNTFYMYTDGCADKCCFSQSMKLIKEIANKLAIDTSPNNTVLNSITAIEVKLAYSGCNATDDPRCNALKQIYYAKAVKPGFGSNIPDNAYYSINDTIMALNDWLTKYSGEGEVKDPTLQARVNELCKDSDDSVYNALWNSKKGFVEVSHIPNGTTINMYTTDCGDKCCLSSSVKLIKQIADKIGTNESGANMQSNNNVQDLLAFIHSSTVSDPCNLPSYTELLKFRDFFNISIPDNTHYNADKDIIPSIETWINHDYAAEDKNAKDNCGNGLCDNILEANIILAPGKWFKELLQMLNCWIIAGISKVVDWGTKLMGLLIDPSFWGGISNNPAVKAGFSASVELVNIIFSVVLVIMAIGTILNLKSYRINDLITKFIIVALLINFTIVIAGSIIDLANYLSLYFLNLVEYSTAGGMTAAWNGIFSGVTSLTSTAATTGILLITILINLLVLIAIIWAFGSILFSLLKRGFMLIVLLILSPFAVISYLLPAKGMGQWWEKWKTAFLKYTFYGVYVAAGLYLGTVMLQSLCKSFVGADTLVNTEMGFIPGMMVSLMASGFLIYIVLLADELAGGSAKATAEGATKIALGLAAGGAIAGAMQLKNAVTTSEGYGKTASTLSATKGLGWIGNAGLKARETSLAYRDKQGSVIDENVNRRDVNVNKARLRELDGSKSPQAAREMTAIAKQLFVKKQMDDDSAKLLEKNAGAIGSDENQRNGWIPYTLKKSLKDLSPSLFTRADLEKDTGMIENEIMDKLTENGGDVEKTAKALAPKGSADQQKKIGDVIKKYFDERAKAGIQFAQNAANTSDKFVLQAILDSNTTAQEQIMERLAQTPATMKHVIEQIENSGLGGDDKRKVYDQFQSYMDRRGSKKFNEKQLDYIDLNVGQINTDGARGRVVSSDIAFTEATAEDARRTQQRNAAIDALDQEIKQAKLDQYTASTVEKAKAAEQHTNELLKKRQDIISGSKRP